MIHNEHLQKADELYEVRHDNNGNAIHVYIKDGEAIIFPSLHDFVMRVYYGQEVERFYLEEDSLDAMYDESAYDYYTLKSQYFFKTHYPFSEGDTYYTIDAKGVIESTWDPVSEELYDADPERVYFTSFDEAMTYYNNKYPNQ
jgi:hypothetical protein